MANSNKPIKVPAGKRPVEFLRGRGCDVETHLRHRPVLRADHTHWLVDVARVVVWSAEWSRHACEFRDCVGVLPPARQRPKSKKTQVKLLLTSEQLASDRWRQVCQWVADTSGAVRTIGGKTFYPEKES